MKTKEEIFEAFEKICRDHDYFNHRIFVYDELKAFLDKSLTDYSDQQNKELSGKIDKLANFIMNEVEGEPSQNEGAIDCAIRIIRQHLNSQINTKTKDAEIQRLTKENDDLRDNASEYIKELTRLRELLGKCRDSLSGTVVNLGFDSPMDYQIAEQLIDDISNALNP